MQGLLPYAVAPLLPPKLTKHDLLEMVDTLNCMLKRREPAAGGSEEAGGARLQREVKRITPRKPDSLPQVEEADNNQDTL